MNFAAYFQGAWIIIALSAVTAWLLAAPIDVKSANCPDLVSGDIFRVPGNSAVYLATGDKHRMYFPNDAVFKTWYDDFSNVKTVPVECLEEYPYPDSKQHGVNYRPGSYLVKNELTPGVFAVLPGGIIRQLLNESVATILYGPDWYLKVKTMSDVFSVNYTQVSAKIESPIPHDGMLVRRPGTDNEIYYIAYGRAYRVNDEIPFSMRGGIQVVNQAMFDAIPLAGTSVNSGMVRGNPAGTSHSNF